MHDDVVGHGSSEIAPGVHPAGIPGVINPWPEINPWREDREDGVLHLDEALHAALAAQAYYQFRAGTLIKHPQRLSDVAYLAHVRFAARMTALDIPPWSIDAPPELRRRPVAATERIPVERIFNPSDALHGPSDRYGETPGKPAQSVPAATSSSTRDKDRAFRVALASSIAASIASVGCLLVVLVVFDASLRPNPYIAATLGLGGFVLLATLLVALKERHSS